MPQSAPHGRVTRYVDYVPVVNECVGHGDWRPSALDASGNALTRHSPLCSASAQQQLMEQAVAEFVGEIATAVHRELLAPAAASSGAKPRESSATDDASSHTGTVATAQAPPSAATAAASPAAREAAERARVVQQGLARADEAVLLLSNYLKSIQAGQYLVRRGRGPRPHRRRASPQPAGRRRPRACVPQRRGPSQRRRPRRTTP